MTTRKLRITVAWRPGGAGQENLTFAAWLAQTCRVEIQFVAIIARGWPLTSLARTSDTDSWVQELTKSTRKHILKAAKHAGLRKGALADEPVLIYESTSEAAEICRAAEDFNADLIVLGSHHNAPEGHFRAGSAADAMLHYSPKPLAVVPGTPHLSKRGVTRVTCSYIDTPQSHIALEKAADLARAWEVPLRLVAFTPSGASMYPDAGHFGTADDLMVEWHEQAMGLLDRGRDRAQTRHPDLRIHTEVGSGNGWEGAVASVKWKKGDLMVLGSSTLGPFGRVFIGSSTNQLLRYLTVPTLITPA
ncbi:universal stress protein [Corynebacterium sp. TAE3-ERU12]|uniref:universal stress protein n=1 Tax=Corynebacterium sp. TAE3-ERU12 TaxID=2849491 RepID=UPI001C44375A|nr:universal stress protein [Corynebacterium sp. TAE3-ERU12]MBV7294323.1 universal stress protein [Corynebacterium sp. TAE3-ERU12]